MGPPVVVTVAELEPEDVLLVLWVLVELEVVLPEPDELLSVDEVI
jgi:hypothetical protein